MRLGLAEGLSAQIAQKGWTSNAWSPYPRDVLVKHLEFLLSMLAGKNRFGIYKLVREVLGENNAYEIAEKKEGGYSTPPRYIAQTVEIISEGSSNDEGMHFSE